MYYLSLCHYRDLVEDSVLSRVDTEDRLTMNLSQQVTSKVRDRKSACGSGMWEGHDSN